MKVNKLFYRQKLTLWDLITIGIWICLSIYFLTIEEITFETRKPIVFYSFGLYFFTLGLNYKSLRNLNSWTLWGGISIIQVLIYYKQGLDQTGWPAINGLRNYWIFLIAFQILRWVSLKFQKEEFVTLSKMKTDLYDNRKFTILDGVLFVLAIFLIFTLQCI